MPCLPHAVTDGAINQSGRVENNRFEFGKVNFAFCIEDAFIGTPVHNFSNHACTALGVFFHFNSSSTGNISRPQSPKAGSFITVLMRVARVKICCVSVPSVLSIFSVQSHNPVVMAAIIIARQVIDFIVSCNFVTAKFGIILVMPITRITADTYIFAVAVIYNPTQACSTHNCFY